MQLPEAMFLERGYRPLTLKIFRSASGRWSGQIFRAGTEIASIGACQNPDEVRQAANASALYPDRIEIVS